MDNVSMIFPLIHFIEAARSVMTDEARIIQILPNIEISSGQNDTDFSGNGFSSFSMGIM